MKNTKMNIAIATLGAVVTMFGAHQTWAATAPVVINLKVTKDFTGGYNADIVLDAAAKAMLSSNPTLSFSLGHSIKSAFGATIVSNTASTISLNKLSQYSIGYTDTNLLSKDLAPKDCSFNSQPCILQLNGITYWSPIAIATPTPTNVVIATPTSTATPTKAPTATPTNAPTATPTTPASATPTTVVTATATPTAVVTATQTPSITPTTKPTSTPTPTPSSTGVASVWGQNFDSLQDGSTWLTSGCKAIKKNHLAVVSNCGGQGSTNKCLKAIYNAAENEPWDPGYYKTWIADYGYTGMPSSDPLANDPHYSYTATCAPYYTGTATDVMQQLLPIGGEDTTQSSALTSKWSGAYPGYKAVAGKLPATEYTLNYDMMFLQSKNEPSVISNAVFDWARGGKLPGLSAAANDSGCTDDGNIGKNNPLNWSARMMWRANGTSESYVYDQGRQSGLCGARVPTKDTYSAEAAMSANKWYSVTMYVKLNTFVGGVAQEDGIVELYLYDNTILVGSAKSTGVKFRGVEDDASKIHSLFFSTFYGGNEQKRAWKKWACDNANGDAGRLAVCGVAASQEQTWEPKLGVAGIPNTIYFDNFAVYPGSTPRIRTAFGK